MTKRKLIRTLNGHASRIEDEVATIIAMHDPGASIKDFAEGYELRFKSDCAAAMREAAGTLQNQLFENPGELKSNTSERAK